MADKALIISETQKYLAKGQIDKAISEWENFLESSPDANCFNTLGDLYLKKKDQQTAIEKFHRAAEIFRKEGFSLKAIALYKKILNIAPSDARSQYALGELSEEKNISADAVKYYLSAAGIYMKDGRKAEAVRTYAKMVRLNSENLPLRKQIADIYSKEGFVDEASNEYVEVARLLEGKGEDHEALAYLERAVEIKPSNRAALAATASLYEKLGDARKAAESLKMAIARTGKSGEFLLPLARLCLEMGKTRESREYAEELLRLDPSNLHARRTVAETYLKEGDMKGAWDRYAPVIEELASAMKFDEAGNILDMFMEAEPIRARRVLIPLLKQKNDSAGVLKELKELGELLQAAGDAGGAVECFNEAIAISPEDGQAAEKLRELQQGADTGTEEKAEAAETDGEEEATEEEKSVLETISRADGMLSAGLASEAVGLLESLKLKAPGSVPLHMKLKSAYLSVNDRQQAVTECIILAELYRRAGNEPGRNEVIEEAFSIDPADARLPERFGRREEKERDMLSAAEDSAAYEHAVHTPDALMDAGEPAVTRVELAEKLSEAAFYLDQGLYEEAEKIYLELKVHFPDDETVSERLEEIKALKEQQQNAWPSGLMDAEQAAQGGKAGDGLDGEVEKIFDEFKKGVEKQIDPGDAETRYNLGIAYKEMGLLDDAIREFETILNVPASGVRAVSVLAGCYMEKGLYSKAAGMLMSAIKNVDPADDAYWGLKYDLAQAREKNSEPKEALELYMEVFGWNSGFREVAQRITALGGSVPGGTGGKKPSSRKDRISYI